MSYTVTLGCQGQNDEVHSFVAWDVVVEPGHDCTHRHAYCGGNNPDCDAEEPEVVEGSAECPICKFDLYDEAMDEAKRLRDRYCEY
jgi:hypothetical protein